MIVITGAAGFIGSCLSGYLFQEGFMDQVIADDFTHREKLRNYGHRQYREMVPREEFFDWLLKHHRFVQFIFHLGARTDTTELDIGLLTRLNLEYSKELFSIAAQFGIPVVYASSAATYGDGAQGFDDRESDIPGLLPLNPYGQSKQDFDCWILEKKKKPLFWAGLKFFNVYGPNEYHKKRMASVIYHAYHQIKQEGTVRLFRSHHPDYSDGGQLRDFIYVKDVVSVCGKMLLTRKNPGIYNLGSGTARSFYDLAKAVFAALNCPESIHYVDMPEDLRERYQYYTCAAMNKLKHAGYGLAFTSLEQGIHDYVTNYLEKDAVY